MVVHHNVTSSSFDDDIFDHLDRVSSPAAATSSGGATSSGSTTTPMMATTISPPSSAAAAAAAAVVVPAATTTSSVASSSVSSSSHASTNSPGEGPYIFQDHLSPISPFTGQQQQPQPQQPPSPYYASPSSFGTTASTKNPQTNSGGNVATTNNANMTSRNPFDDAVEASGTMNVTTAKNAAYHLGGRIAATFFGFGGGSGGGTQTQTSTSTSNETTGTTTTTTPLNNNNNANTPFVVPPSGSTTRQPLQQGQEFRRSTSPRQSSTTRGTQRRQQRRSTANSRRTPSIASSSVTSLSTHAIYSDSGESGSSYSDSEYSSSSSYDDYTSTSGSSYFTNDYSTIDGTTRLKQETDGRSTYTQESDFVNQNNNKNNKTEQTRRTSSSSLRHSYKYHIPGSNDQPNNDTNQMSYIPEGEESAASSSPRSRPRQDANTNSSINMPSYKIIPPRWSEEEKLDIDETQERLLKVAASGAAAPVSAGGASYSYEDDEMYRDNVNDDIMVGVNSGAPIPIQGTNYVKKETKIDQFKTKTKDSMEKIKVKTTQAVSTLSVRTQQAYDQSKRKISNLKKSGKGVDDNDVERNGSANGSSSSGRRNNNSSRSRFVTKLRHYMIDFISNCQRLLGRIECRRSAMLTLVAVFMLILIIGVSVGIVHTQKVKRSSGEDDSYIQEDQDGKTDGVGGNPITPKPPSSGAADDDYYSDYYYPTPSPTGSPLELTKRMQNVLPLILQLTPPHLLQRSDTPQSRALQWLTEKDTFFESTGILESPIQAVQSSSSSSRTGADSANIPQMLEQRYVLATLYFSTNGSGWNQNKNWLSSQHSVCDWYGITCISSSSQDVSVLMEQVQSFTSSRKFRSSYSESISSLLWEQQQRQQFLATSDNISNKQFRSLKGITLDYNNLVGQLPMEVTFVFPQLQVLSLHHNEIKGTIPESIGLLESLQFLYLDTNQFSGPIPPSVSNLAKLQELTLSQNELEGELPEGLYHLTNLKIVWCHSNQLQGTISDRLGSLWQLQEFYVDHNSLRGRIPSTIGQLQNLKELNLSDNHLTGRIPSTIGRLQQALKYFNVGRNSLTGTIPQTLYNLRQLTELHLEQNYFKDLLKANQLSQLNQLKVLHLQNNTLKGDDILEPIMALTKLEELRLGDNLFKGTIPDRIGRKLKKLRILHLEHNQFNGPLPTELGLLSELRSLNLFSNRFKGHIPTELGQLTNCRQFYADKNQLTGTIPSQLGQLPLEYLYLSENKLKGSIPSELFVKNQRMIDLRLHTNQLEGTLPDTIGNPRRTLQILYLQNNKLRGTLPQTLGRLQHLMKLYLQNNKFSGQLPSTDMFGGMLALEELYLDNNLFVGTIPHELGSLQQLSKIRLEHNTFEGVLPETVCQLKHLEQLISDCSYKCTCCTSCVL